MTTHDGCCHRFPRNDYTTPFRLYDARMGTWMTQDPILHAGVSPYLGLDANPISTIDPWGLDGTSTKSGGSNTGGSPTMTSTVTPGTASAITLGLPAGDAVGSFMMAANGYWYTLMQGPANGPNVWTATIVVRASESGSDGEPTIRQSEVTTMGKVEAVSHLLSVVNLGGVGQTYDFIDQLYIGLSGFYKTFARAEIDQTFHMNGIATDAQEDFDARFGTFQLIASGGMTALEFGLARISAEVMAELAASKPSGTGTVLAPARTTLPTNPAAYEIRPTTAESQMVGGMAAEGPKVINPADVRYSQSSIRPPFKSYPGTIYDLATGLESGAIDPMAIPPIRLTYVDELLYSIDNRRLWAFKEAGVKAPYRMATPKEVAKAIKDGKFSTKNNGTSIKIRAGKD